MSQITLDKFTHAHGIDFDINIANLTREHAITETRQWAVDYSTSAPVFHVTEVDTAMSIVSTHGPLKSHALLYPTKVYGGAVENTVGRTAEFDVVCGLDEFVFLSLGKLAVADTGAFAAFVLHKDVLHQGIASFKDIAAMNAIVLSPEEQFNEENADQDEIAKVNTAIMADFAASLLPARDFAAPFSSYLGENFSNVEEFLREFSYKKGYIDLPVVGTPAYDELSAMVRMFNALAPGRSFDYFKHGHYYAGPQIMIPNTVDLEYVESIVVYEGTTAESTGIMRLLRMAQKRGISVDVVTNAEIANHISVNSEIEIVDVTMSELYIATRAAMNVLFNKKVM